MKETCISQGNAVIFFTCDGQIYNHSCQKIIKIGPLLVELFKLCHHFLKHGVPCLRNGEYVKLITHKYIFINPVTSAVQALQ